MNNSNMKNMIVLKDLPSNMIEEAIVVLKSNIKVKNYELVDNKKENNITKNLPKPKEYILKEAENIISNYIAKIERPKEEEKRNRTLQKKCKKLKQLCIFLGMVAGLAIIMSIIK